jgi:glucose/arabinose dehydrogenase
VGNSSGIRRRLALLAALAVLLALPAGAGAAMLPGFESDRLVGGLTQPVNVAWTPDGRMFVAEKPGVLKVVPPGGGAAQVVLHFKDEVNSASDRGFLGLAVDSSFTQNGYLYLLYTAEAHPLFPDGSGQSFPLATYSRLERVEVNAASQVVARVDILGTASPADGACVAGNSVDCIPSDGLSHGIGTVISAPDGTLYVGVGDAAGWGEVDDKAFRTYDEESLAGKILHVDRNGLGLPGHAFCSSNTNLTHVCTKIHAKGFRNPYRFTQRPDGSLVVGDVGWERWEELDLVTAAGTAWGWPCYEGNHRTPGYRDHPRCDAEYDREGTPSAHRNPVHEYPHGATGGAILAGPTYTELSYPPEYRGAFFIADYTSGWVKRVSLDAGGEANVHDFIDGWSGLHLGAAPNGDLVYIDPGNFGPGAGSIHRVSYAPGNAKPVASAGADPQFGETAPLTVAFDGSASHDPDDDELEFHWDFGDGETSAAMSPSHTYSSTGIYDATLTVDDGRGGTDVADPIRIDVGNDAPVAQMEVPATFQAGEAVLLSGSASDAEDGSIPGEGLTWNVILVHNDHQHPQPVLTGALRPFVAVADHDADSHYKITLVAVDSHGLTGSVTATVGPETAEVRLESTPPGAPLSYGGRSLTAPTRFPSAVGFRTSVSAAEDFAHSGRVYVFRAWSDGGGRLHALTVPTDGLSLVAEYDPMPIEPPGAEGDVGDANGGEVAGGSDGAGGSGGGGGGETGGDAPDTRGPLLGFDARRGFGARRGILKGRVSDGSGVSRVEAAFARRSGRRCRWWSTDVARAALSASSCSRPRWMRSRLTQIRTGLYRWRLRLGTAPPAGAYLLRLRAFDATGNRTNLSAGVRAARR